MKKYFKSTGFTLIETLIAVMVIGVIGTMITTLLSKSFQGSAKTQIIGLAKQNGQSALNVIDETIRSADAIVCPSATSTGDSITILKGGSYLRFKYVAAVSTTSNGQIVEDVVNPDPAPITNVCGAFLASYKPIASCPETFCSTTNSTNVLTLTDAATVTGVSVGKITNQPYIFNITRSPGARDTVQVSFGVGPGVQYPSGFQNQLGPTGNIPFQTIVQVRSKQ